MAQGVIRSHRDVGVPLFEGRSQAARRALVREPFARVDAADLALGYRVDV